MPRYTIVKAHTRRNPKRKRNKKAKSKKSCSKNSKKTVLGICPYCGKEVYKITEKTRLGGRKPKWVHTNRDHFYHQKCWDLRKKSKPKNINIKYSTPMTPIGQFEIEKQDSEE